MALVASYGGISSSEEDSSDDETPVMRLSESKGSPEPPRTDKSPYNEDDPFTDEETVPTETTLLTSSLPAPIAKSSASGFVDETEDVSDIPLRKSYEENPPQERPPTAKKKVQIKLPTLKSLFKDMDESQTPSVGPQTGDSEPFVPRNSITAFLPPPKHGQSPFLKNKPSSSTKKDAIVPFVPRAVFKKPAPSKTDVRPAKVRKEVDSSDDDEEEDGSFFSFHDKLAKEPSSSSLPLPVVLNPEVPLEAEPLLGPSKPPSSPPSYPEPPSAEDLMRNEAALERLAGKHALRKKEHINNVIEIDGNDNRADPKVWLTKAVTEDELSKPGPRVTIKGVQKSRHQITYLAQLAKANEFKLQQEWSNNAHSRKQSAQKYGF